MNRYCETDKLSLTSRIFCSVAFRRNRFLRGRLRNCRANCNRRPNHDGNNDAVPRDGFNGFAVFFSGDPVKVKTYLQQNATRSERLAGDIRRNNISRCRREEKNAVDAGVAGLQPPFILGAGSARGKRYFDRNTSVRESPSGKNSFRYCTTRTSANGYNDDNSWPNSPRGRITREIRRILASACIGLVNKWKIISHFLYTQNGRCFFINSFSLKVK